MAFYSGSCRVCGEHFDTNGLTSHPAKKRCQQTAVHCFWCCTLTPFGGIPDHGNFTIVFTNHKTAPTADHRGPVTMFHDA
jgi:hypothetical protein